MQHILYLTCVELENETLSFNKKFYNLVGFTDQIAASLASVTEYSFSEVLMEALGFTHPSTPNKTITMIH